MDRGGSLVLLGGPSSLPEAQMNQTALADLLPIKPPAAYQEGNFKVQITDGGLHSPVFGPVFAQVKDFPPLLTANVGGKVAPSAQVLMQTLVNGHAQPLIATMRFGKGRVAEVMSDSVWRWRLGAAQWRLDKSPYELFWTQLLDWMVPKEEMGAVGDSIELFTERSSYTQGEKPEVRAVVQTADGHQPGSLPLRVHTPDGKVLDYTLKPGVFQGHDGRSVRGFLATIEPNVTGIFRAQTGAILGGAPVSGEVRIVVTRPATELTGKPIDRDFLEKLSTASNGRYYPLGGWDRWTADLHVRERHSTPPGIDRLVEPPDSSWA